MNRHRTACQRMPESALVDLPPAATHRYGVIFRNHAFSLHTEDPFQIRAAGAPEGSAAFFGFHSESCVEFTNVAFTQKTIAFFHLRDAGEA